MSNKAILCVDDERIVLVSLRDQITKHFGSRYRSEFAESVEEAWEVIEELKLDEVKILIIVCDWLMPGIRGDEFLIQVHQRFPEIVTIMLTGQADEAAIERARQYADLHAYIPKPWSEANLIAAIESGLEKINV
ncbi:MAG TPA: hypothetical protein DDW76_18825 [Cyanobacteria bacterium UBA11369]|nr:hypothetical protein [Cyanobacteria bacterium UBA11371]HBE36816.1 hypothetical protein [Cyanobacteria bacterium UBA11368]HBE50766.1 hypothetical protein [Cyanobacteria bacterium UBA11369]